MTAKVDSSYAHTWVKHFNSSGELLPGVDLSVDCGICGTALAITTPADNTHQSFAVLPCGHAFGHACITQWFRYTADCPQCRRRIRHRACGHSVMLRELQGGGSFNPHRDVLAAMNTDEELAGFCASCRKALYAGLANYRHTVPTTIVLPRHSICHDGMPPMLQGLWPTAPPQPSTPAGVQTLADYQRQAIMTSTQIRMGHPINMSINLTYPGPPLNITMSYDADAPMGVTYRHTGNLTGLAAHAGQAGRPGQAGRAPQAPSNAAHQMASQQVTPSGQMPQSGQAPPRSQTPQQPGHLPMPPTGQPPRHQGPGDNFF
ncbi:hypothetical protein F4802DRAFT_615238 [Xylaria palmicola]|nr:hypothetical protein F4802DRAFT_615238 [Xylaria palmicola]